MATGWKRDSSVLPWEICWIPCESGKTQRRKNERLMVQQKSDRPVVPEGCRKAPQTERITKPGGKGSAVTKQAQQHELSLGTAAKCEKHFHGTPEKDLSVSGVTEEPKPKAIEKQAELATMEAVSRNLGTAMMKVVKNQGAPGPDRIGVEEVCEHWPIIEKVVRSALEEGSYRPGMIRRVYIPKPGGGERGLGIPDVVDRVVQEAIRMALEPIYEPQFHGSSHGFRPGRSCHTAIMEARGHVEAGFGIVVDIDLEKFFDRVNHQRLMERLGRDIKDVRLLRLLNYLLKAKVVLPGGLVEAVTEGVPQGGPLSPLLSNIVLTELDEELERRGHRFVRYADDCNVYVKSERAGQRVMASLKAFIEKRLRLKVNEKKSAVARPGERHFLGFSLYQTGTGETGIRLSARSLSRIREKIKELTPRNSGRAMDSYINGLNTYLRGWLGFFGLVWESTKEKLEALDAHIRRRLRAIQLHHWKRKLTIAKRLIQLGALRCKAYGQVYHGRRGIWVLSHIEVVDRTLRNSYFKRLGLYSLAGSWKKVHQRLVAPYDINQGAEVRS